MRCLRRCGNAGVEAAIAAAFRAVTWLPVRISAPAPAGVRVAGEHHLVAGRAAGDDVDVAAPSRRARVTAVRASSDGTE